MPWCISRMRTMQRSYFFYCTETVHVRRKSGNRPLATCSLDQHVDALGSASDIPQIPESGEKSASLN